MTDSRSPIRSLHVVGQLEYGGVSSWLKALVCGTARTDLVVDICCTYRLGRGALAGWFENAGSRVHYVAFGANPFAYNTGIVRLLGENAYQVVHEHRSFLAGATLRPAARAGVPLRIVYHHTPDDDRAKGFARRTYEGLLKRWSLRYATHLWGCSEAALAGQYGQSWKTADPRLDVVYGGIVAPQPAPDARQRVRAEFGIPTSARVVGYIGRVTLPKNPLVALAAGLQVLQTASDMCMLFVGDGPQLAEARRIAALNPAGARVFFTGFRIDTADLMVAMDVLLQPSRFEGLGLTWVEALALGLPVAASRAPGILEALPQSFHRYTADADDVQAHVQHVLDILEAKPRIEWAEGLSRFSAEAFGRRLIERYRAALASCSSQRAQ